MAIKCKYCGAEALRRKRGYDAMRFDFKIWLLQCERCGANHRLDGSLIEEPDTEVP